jgi:hypothetical protein
MPKWRVQTQDDTFVDGDHRRKEEKGKKLRHTNECHILWPYDAQVTSPNPRWSVRRWRPWRKEEKGKKSYGTQTNATDLTVRSQGSSPVQSKKSYQKAKHNYKKARRQACTGSLNFAFSMRRRTPKQRRKKAQPQQQTRRKNTAKMRSEKIPRENEKSLILKFFYKERRSKKNERKYENLVKGALYDLLLVRETLPFLRAFYFRSISSSTPLFSKRATIKEVEILAKDASKLRTTWSG